MIGGTRGEPFPTSSAVTLPGWRQAASSPSSACSAAPVLSSRTCRSRTDSRCCCTPIDLSECQANKGETQEKQRSPLSFQQSRLLATCCESLAPPLPPTACPANCSTSFCVARQPPHITVCRAMSRRSPMHVCVHQFRCEVQPTL